MDRRTLLQSAAGVAGGSVVGGYLVVADRGPCGSGDHRWCYGVKARLEAVSNGMVFVREWPDWETPGTGEVFEIGPTADGEIVALDAETGDIRWSYGEAIGSDSYTDLAISDGIYFGYCTDQMGHCTDLTALEFDGAERWVRAITPGPFGPIVDDGTVYDAEYGGPIRALDAESGAIRWERDVGGERMRLSHVGDGAVYVETETEVDDSVVSIDRETGDLRWRYRPAGDQVVTGSAVANGVVYVVTFGRIAAVTGGDELWRREFGEIEGQPEIEGIGSGRLFLLVESDRTEDGRREFRLDAIALATGDRDWTLGSIEHPDPEYSPRVIPYGESVYVGTDRLQALDIATGEERWSVWLEDGPIQSVSVVDAGASEDHAVFTHTGDRIAGFTPGGEQTLAASVPGEIRNYLVDELVFVSTDEGIYGLDRRSIS